MKRKILIAADMACTLALLVLSVLMRDWMCTVVVSGYGLNDILYWHRDRQYREEKRMRKELQAMARDTVNLNHKLLRDLRRSESSLRLAETAYQKLMDQENTTAGRYAKAKARMCAGLANCNDCPLKKAGREHGKIDEDGCQMMLWCELYAYAHPEEAVRMVLEWEEEHGA